MLIQRAIKRHEIYFRRHSEGRRTSGYFKVWRTKEKALTYRNSEEPLRLEASGLLPLEFFY